MRFVIVLLMCLGFTYGAGMMDFYIGGGVLRQVWALTYARAPGVVTHSAVGAVPPVEGGSTYYRADVRYSYAVDGAALEGGVLRYTELESSLPSELAGIVRAYPVGAPVVVRYDANNPGASLLEPGIHANDLFQLMMITPFNMAAAFLCYLAWSLSPLPMPERNYGEAGARTIEYGAMTRVRFTFYRPIFSGVVTFMVAVFVGLIVAALCSGAFRIWFMLLDWATVLGVSGWVFWTQWRKQESGAADLVIDKAAKTVELPAHFGRKTREVWTFADVKDVEVETIERRGSRGSVTYIDQVRLVRQTGWRELIEELGDREQADHFARWLRVRLRA